MYLSATRQKRRDLLVSGANLALQPVIERTELAVINQDIVVLVLESIEFIAQGSVLGSFLTQVLCGLVSNLSFFDEHVYARVVRIVRLREIGFQGVDGAFRFVTLVQVGVSLFFDGG